MASINDVKIEESTLEDEDFEDQDYILTEEEIKVEETCLQDTAPPKKHPCRVIIEQKFSVCSMCRYPFERKRALKFLNQGDFHKCNKCILHSRLFSLKNGAKKRRKKDRECPKSDCDDDVIIVEDAVNDSVSIKKMMFICLDCKTSFERNQPIKCLQESDWYRCNKCILHSRLSEVFKKNSKCIQSVSK